MVESMALPTPESPDSSPEAAGQPLSDPIDDECTGRRAAVEDEMIRLEQADREAAERAAAARASVGPPPATGDPS